MPSRTSSCRSAIDVATAVADLVGHFEKISRERMRGLPIVNTRLDVEAIGFGYLGEHQLGVLLTPWFMNLLILPGTDEWSELARGSTVEWPLPNGNCDFTICRDDTLGTYLTAVLFRTVVDFPDQGTARAVAEDILGRLWTNPGEPVQIAAENSLSRRALFTGLRTP